MAQVPTTPGDTAEPDAAVFLPVEPEIPEESFDELADVEPREREPRPEPEVAQEPAREPVPPPQRHPVPPPRSEPPRHQPASERRPASPESVRSAIVHVSEIIESLNATLDDMEEVLETLELAERQKDADEREIESLRRALRQVQRPRDSGSANRGQ